MAKPIPPQSTAPDPVCRLRVEYAKRGRLRYLGHLEVLRTVERSIRRAGLPFAVTQGFSPHMRVQFTSALPVGVSSLHEYFDVLLTREVDASEALEALRTSMPEDLGPARAEVLPVRVPALEAWLNALSWHVEVRALDGSTLDASEAERSLQALVARGTLEYLRGTKPKTVDLTQAIISCDVDGGEGGAVCLDLVCACGEHGQLRPDALVRAVVECMGAPACSIDVCRTEQGHRGEDGQIVKPFSR